MGGGSGSLDGLSNSPTCHLVQVNNLRKLRGMGFAGVLFHMRMVRAQPCLRSSSLSWQERLLQVTDDMLYWADDKGNVLIKGQWKKVGNSPS
jgi:hypothetical protein